MKKVVALALVSILLVFFAGCSNSKAGLEKKLSADTWYCEYEFDDVPCLRTLEFHLDGQFVQSHYYYSIVWHSTGRTNGSWEIMEDKELRFDGDYYDWEDGWRLSGNKLIIGGYEYTNIHKEYYPD